MQEGGCPDTSVRLASSVRVPRALGKPCLVTAPWGDKIRWQRTSAAVLTVNLTLRQFVQRSVGYDVSVVFRECLFCWGWCLSLHH
jgi:hypothetical protein